MPVKREFNSRERYSEGEGDLKVVTTTIIMAVCASIFQQNFHSANTKTTLLDGYIQEAEEAA